MIAINGVPSNPGCDEPFRTMGVVKSGRGESRAEGLNTQARNGEVDRIGPPRFGVGIENRLAKRSRAAVGRRGHEKKSVSDLNHGLSSKTPQTGRAGSGVVHLEPRRRCVTQAVERRIEAESEPLYDNEPLPLPEPDRPTDLRKSRPGQRPRASGSKPGQPARHRVVQADRIPPADEKISGWPAGR